MQNLSWTIDRHDFHVTIDGHTKAKLDLGRDNYSSWELSADRANAARRSLVHYAVDPDMIERITGYADTRPLPGERPEAEANQRITLSLALRATRESSDTGNAGKSIDQAARDAQPTPAS